MKVKTLLLQLCALHKFYMTDGQNTRNQITSDGRSKCVWSNCILCIPFILSGSPNECWLHTCDACVIATWRLGLWAPLVACNIELRTTVNKIIQLAVRAGLELGAYKLQVQCLTAWPCCILMCSSLHYCITGSPILLIAGCKSNLFLFCCRSWWMWRWRNSWSRIKMWKNKRERGQ